MLTKRIQINPMNPLNGNSIEDKKYFNYFSVNKKNSILIDTNYINNQKEINSKDTMNNLRLNSVDKKLPLYQKTFKNINILDRNNNISLNNNKLNIISLNKISHSIIKDKKNMILNNIKNYPYIEDNNIKLEKPVKLKLELLNYKNQSNLISKMNSS